MVVLCRNSERESTFHRELRNALGWIIRVYTMQTVVIRGNDPRGLNFYNYLEK